MGLLRSSHYLHFVDLSTNGRGVIVDILLTGANGQLGWEILRRADAEGLSICATTRAQLNITDREVVIRYVNQLRPKVIVNTAAYTAVDNAENDAESAYAVNYDGVSYLSEVCASLGSLLIHISTDYVFDGTKTEAYTERDSVAPLGIYGASKLAGENAVRKLCSNHVILRTSWVYGVHGNNFVKTMLRAGLDREVIQVVDDQHGSPTFAGDLAETILIIANRNIKGTVPVAGFGTFHCAGHGYTTWCGFARKVFELSKPCLSRIPKVHGIPTAAYQGSARRPGNSVLNCRHLARTFDIQLRSWEEALLEMLNEIFNSKK